MAGNSAPPTRDGHIGQSAVDQGRSPSCLSDRGDVVGCAVLLPLSAGPADLGRETPDRNLEERSLALLN
jgi:hypothetical protein